MAEYGPRVLGEPEEQGFGLAAYLVPIARRARRARARGRSLARRWRRPATAAPDGARRPSRSPRWTPTTRAGSTPSWRAFDR